MKAKLLKTDYYKIKTLEDLEGEIWIDAYGFSGIYEVSNLGRLKSLGRYVNNGNGERWVKDRIISQSLGKKKDKRLTCAFAVQNKRYSLNVSGIIWQSFNYTESLLHNEVVQHKNKIAYDNRLENLEKTTVSKSHSNNSNHGLLDHLHKSNKQRTIDYLKLTHKTCKECNEKKEIVKFEFGRNTCMKCRHEYKKINYKKSS